MHYKRWWRLGSVDLPCTSVEDRFWSQVNVTDNPDECWLWKKSVEKDNLNSYGHFGLDRKVLIASRAAWKLSYGDVPEGLSVLHYCDTPACCNPTHLFLGTTQDNVIDCKNKGRLSKRSGEHNNASKLTRSQVEQIRIRYKIGDITQVELGRQYGVSGTMIGYIVRNMFWADA